MPFKYRKPKNARIFEPSKTPFNLIANRFYKNGMACSKYDPKTLGYSDFENPNIESIQTDYYKCYLIF